MTVKRLLHDYALAIWFGADKRVTRLAPVAMRLARARLQYGVGPLRLSVYHLAGIPPARWHDYILRTTPVDLQLMAVNAEPGRSITGNKLRMYEHCIAAGLPTIPVLCWMGNRAQAGDGSVEHVTDPARLDALLATAPARLFAKPVRGSHGTGACVVTRDATGFVFADRHGSAQQLFAWMLDNCGPQDAFMFQPQVRPYPGLSGVGAADGLPTVRLVTAMFADGPHVVFACFKIPTGASVVDNFHNGLGGNLLAAIDLQTGTLVSAVGSRRRDWPVLAPVDVHPDTGQPIAGLRLPLWDELQDVALRGQRSLPALKTIGWDMAITLDGPVIVEANYKYDMHILQMAYQRGLKAEFAALMDRLRS